MQYKEIHKNIFTIDKKYYLAQCLSIDCNMGDGIAVKFKKKFSKISSLIPNYYSVGDCILVDRVFNLFTKKVYYGKPTYITFTKAIVNMRNMCELYKIEYLAMPKIGCGLDKLSWGKTREIIKETFKDTAIEIIICSL